MTIVFTKALNGGIAPGQWQACAKGQNIFKATLSCPSCGYTCSLRESHKIEDSGIVTPSLVCPVAPCDFHEFITLEDWEPQA